MTAQAVWAGRTYDYECSRTTHRMQATLAILKAAGVEPTTTHSDTKSWDWPTSREVHVCDHKCKTTWPEWIGPETVTAAYTLADRIITRRGTYNRSAASKAKVAASA